MVRLDQPRFSVWRSYPMPEQSSRRFPAHRSHSSLIEAIPARALQLLQLGKI
jgi:hypothetical protein